MDGLIIKKKWLDLIAEGKKTLEIRGCNTGKRSSVYLLESGSQKVRAICKIMDAFPISGEDWNSLKEKHCVPISYEELKKRYKNPHAWVLGDICPVEENITYEHPKGAVIWVKDVKIKNK